MKYRIDFINSSYRRFFKKHGKEIDKVITDCLSKGRLMLREDTWKLEENLAKFTRTKYCATVGSGTDALFLSLLALGVGKGDEVITVSNTFIATIQAIVHAGATPILVDVGEDELIDIEKLEKALTKKTKAIIPVHYTGEMADMASIMRLAESCGIYVIEDVAQAIGATLGGKYAGSWGDLGCFSFNNAKLLGGIDDGGAVVTNNRKLYEKICLLRNHWNVHQLSVNAKDYPQPKVMKWAWKSRIGNVNAAFLNVKFKYIKQNLERRKEIAIYYNAWFDGLPVTVSTQREGRVWQEYHLRTKERNKFVKYLKNKGIETLVRDSVPNHKQKGLGLSHFNLPITEKLAKQVVRLPLYPELSDKEVDYIVKTVRKFYGEA